tara:strand:+ start:4329 stop:4748 length:420 start_codon:yes stop_codon:yes gene_type:complete
MISNVRDYIKARILAEDSDFKEWKDGFNRDNIPKSIFNKAFFISYSLPSNNASGPSLSDDSVSVQAELFFKGFRSVQDALDDAMDIADNIYRRAPNNANYTDNIKKVDGISIVPEPLEGNDNAIIITINWNVRIIRCLI